MLDGFCCFLKKGATRGENKLKPIPHLYQGIYLLVFFLQWVGFSSSSKRFHRLFLGEMSRIGIKFPFSDTILLR